MNKRLGITHQLVNKRGGVIHLSKRCEQLLISSDFEGSLVKYNLIANIRLVRLRAILKTRQLLLVSLEIHVKLVKLLLGQ